MEQTWTMCDHVVSLGFTRARRSCTERCTACLRERSHQDHGTSARYLLSLGRCPGSLARPTSMLTCVNWPRA